MRLSVVCAMLIAAVTAEPALAQSADQPDGYARLGVARIRLVDKGKIFINGVQDPNADYRTPERWVANVDLGWFVTRNVAVQLSATTPATTSNVPAGSLQGLPNLGNDTFSIFTLTGIYHPLRGGRVSPYVGGGVALQHVWDTDDRLAQNLRVDDAVGPVIQGGIEIAINQRFGAYFDARKAFLTADASGDLGPNRVTAKAKLDPFIMQAGLLVRF